MSCWKWRVKSVEDGRIELSIISPHNHPYSRYRLNAHLAPPSQGFNIVPETMASMFRTFSRDPRVRDAFDLAAATSVIQDAVATVAEAGEGEMWGSFPVVKGVAK